MPGFLTTLNIVYSLFLINAESMPSILDRVTPIRDPAIEISREPNHKPCHTTLGPVPTIREDLVQ
jgi:hypothetical protein